MQYDESYLLEELFKIEKKRLNKKYILRDRNSMDGNKRRLYRKYFTELFALKKRSGKISVANAQKTNYECRQKFANTRERVKGKFVTTKPKKLKSTRPRGRPRKIDLVTQSIPEQHDLPHLVAQSFPKEQNQTRLNYSSLEQPCFSSPKNILSENEFNSWITTLPDTTPVPSQPANSTCSPTNAAAQGRALYGFFPPGTSYIIPRHLRPEAEVKNEYISIFLNGM